MSHKKLIIYYRYIIYNPYDSPMTDLFHIKRATSVRTGSDNVFPILCYKKRIEHRIVFQTTFEARDPRTARPSAYGPWIPSIKAAKML